MDAPLGPPAPTSVSITAVQRVFDVAELRDLILEELFASHHSRFAAIKDQLSCSAVSRAFRQSCRLDRLQTDHFRTAVSPTDLPLIIIEDDFEMVQDGGLCLTTYPVMGKPHNYYTIYKEDVLFNPVLFDLLPLSTIATQSFSEVRSADMVIYHNDFFPSTWEGFNGHTVRNRITVLSYEYSNYGYDDIGYDAYCGKYGDYRIYEEPYGEPFKSWVVQEVPREGHLAYPFFLPAAEDDGTWSDSHPLQNVTSGITLKDLAAPYFRNMYLTQPPLQRLNVGLYMKGAARSSGDRIWRDEDDFVLFDPDGLKIGHLIVLLAQFRNELCQRAAKRGHVNNYRTPGFSGSNEFTTFGWDFDGRTRIAFSPYLDRNPQDDGYAITREGHQVTGYRVNSLLEGQQHAGGSGTIKKKFDCDEIWQGLEHAGFGWMLSFLCGVDFELGDVFDYPVNEVQKRGWLAVDRITAHAGHILKLVGNERDYRTWMITSKRYHMNPLRA